MVRGRRERSWTTNDRIVSRPPFPRFLSHVRSTTRDHVRRRSLCRIESYSGGRCDWRSLMFSDVLRKDRFSGLASILHLSKRLEDRRARHPGAEYCDASTGRRAAYAYSWEGRRAPLDPEPFQSARACENGLSGPKIGPMVNISASPALSIGSLPYPPGFSGKPICNGAAGCRAGLRSVILPHSQNEQRNVPA